MSKSALKKDIKPPVKARRGRKPEEVKTKVLDAALNEFAAHGYEGTSVRDVARSAHVSLSLLLYHFQSKDNLWRAVVDDLHERISLPNLLQEGSVDQSATEQLKLAIRAMVKTFSDIPQLHRLMTHEAHQPSERLIWMCESFIKEDFNALCALIVKGQQEGTVNEFNPAQLRFAMVAIAAVPFAVSGEYQYLTKKNPFNAAEQESTIEILNRLVFK
jgi:TetR/AcrR family transcriptional regulator